MPRALAGTTRTVISAPRDLLSSPRTKNTITRIVPDVQVINLDNATSAGGATNNITGVFSYGTHKVNAGSNQILIVSAAYNNDTTKIVSSITWVVGGTTQNLTYTNARPIAGTNAKSIEFWYVLAPTQGTGTITVTSTATNQAIVVGASSWNGVNQTTPFANSNNAYSATGNSATPSVGNISTSLNQVTVDAIVVNNTAVTTTPNAAQTLLFTRSATGMISSGSYRVNGSSMSWTMTSAIWAIVSLSLRSKDQ